MNKLELANSVLERCRLDTITDFTDSLLDQFPYNNLLCFMDEAISTFSNQQIWSWGNYATDLIYFESTAIYDLRDLIIDPKMITLVYTIDPSDLENKQELSAINSTEFNNNYANSSNSGKPSVYCIDGNFLKLYPIPDKDYEIKIDNFKQIPFLISAEDKILIIPEQFQMPIKDYVCACMSMLVEKRSSSKFDDNYMRGYSRLVQANQINGGQESLPSNIDWGVSL